MAQDGAGGHPGGRHDEGVGVQRVEQHRDVGTVHLLEWLRGLSWWSRLVLLVVGMCRCTSVWHCRGIPDHVSAHLDVTRYPGPG